MFEVWMENQLWHYVLLAVCVMGAGMELLLGMGYSRFIKRTIENNGRAQKFMDGFRQDFFENYQYSLNVNNVDKFVDKHVNKQKFMGIYLYIWEKRCGQARIVSGAIAVLSLVMELYYGCGKKQWIENAAWLTILCTMWISFVLLSNCSGKKKQLHWNLTEYLENVYIPRLQLEKGNPKQFQRMQGNLKVQKQKEEEKNVQEKEVEQKEAQQKVTTQSKRRKEKAADKKVQSKNPEMERVKKDLAEELKQERIARKQRLKKQKMEEEKSLTEEKKKQPEAVEGKEKEERVKQDTISDKAQQETKNTEEKAGEKKVELTADGEQLLQDILREYLGEA